MPGISKELAHSYHNQLLTVLDGVPSCRGNGFPWRVLATNGCRGSFFMVNLVEGLLKNPTRSFEEVFQETLHVLEDFKGSDDESLRASFHWYTHTIYFNCNFRGGIIKPDKFTICQIAEVFEDTKNFVDFLHIIMSSMGDIDEAIRKKSREETSTPVFPPIDIEAVWKPINFPEKVSSFDETSDEEKTPVPSPEAEVIPKIEEIPDVEAEVETEVIPKIEEIPEVEADVKADVKADVEADVEEISKAGTIEVKESECTIVFVPYQGGYVKLVNKNGDEIHIDSGDITGSLRPNTVVSVTGNFKKEIGYYENVGPIEIKNKVFFGHQVVNNGWKSITSNLFKGDIHLFLKDVIKTDEKKILVKFCLWRNKEHGNHVAFDVQRA